MIPPNSILKLNPGGIHIWQCRLDIAPERLQELSALLSPEEQARAAAFHHELLRNRHIAAHGFLRKILARYTGRHAADLAFSRHPQGKPFLLQNGNAAHPGTAFPDIRFNLSHSEDLMLCAVARHVEIGIDIEHIRYDFDVMTLAPCCLPLKECNAIRQLASPERERFFFRQWTRKEAQCKATGEGLFVPSPPKAGKSPTAHEHLGRVFDLPMGPGIAATLAVEDDKAQAPVLGFEMI